MIWVLIFSIVSIVGAILFVIGIYRGSYMTGAGSDYQSITVYEVEPEVVTYTRYIRK